MPTHPTLLVTLLNIAILTLLIVVALITKNPLVILGVLLLQQTPLVSYVNKDDAAGEESEYGTSNAGFHAKL